MSQATQPTGAHLPGAMEVRDVLASIVTQDVTLRPGPPFAVSDFYPATIATFVDDRLVVRAVAALDLPLSALAGAALRLVPRGEATRAITAGAVSGPIASGVDDLCDRLVSLFDAGGAPVLRLYAAHLAGQPLPADARMRTQVLGRRQDFLVTLAGYGTGRLAIVLAT